jgi:hypothetical protein
MNTENDTVIAKARKEKRQKKKIFMPFQAIYIGDAKRGP